MEEQSSTLELASSRNKDIRELMNRGRVPILPFEFSILVGRLNSLKERQGSLSRLMGAAMEDSSETWHDNAPAEVIASESVNIVSRARDTINIRDSAEVFNYPLQDLEEVTLGTLVAISFDGESEQESILLTGAVRELNEDVATHFPEDTDCATLQSPIGEALLGARVGDTVTYAAKDRVIEVQVHGLVQTDQSFAQ